MTEDAGSNGGGPKIAIIAVVALAVVAGAAIWAVTQKHPAEKRDGTTVSGSATAGGKDSDVTLKVNLPDSVTVEAH